MKLSNLKRIVAEDFPAEQQELVSKLAFSLNPILEQISNAFNNNIDFDNLNQERSSFDVVVDANGKPITAVELSYSLKTKPLGITVTRADCISSPIAYPTAAPFITFDYTSNGGVRILHVAGLPASKKFRLSVILIA